MIARRTPLVRTALKRKPRRYVVPPEVLAYWDWIREQPCAVCLQNWDLEFGIMNYDPDGKIEAAHVGIRGLAQKCDPWEVIPLCKMHHDRGMPHSHHTLGKKFWSFHNLDRYEVIRRFREQYFSLIGTAASRDTGSVRPGGGL